MSQQNLEWPKFFPYAQGARSLQARVLTELETRWDEYDVFVVVAPTASGKTALMKTLQDWKYHVTCITPTNQLVSQFLEEFPQTRCLHRLDSYECHTYEGNSCARTRGKEKGFCKRCPASSDLAQAKYRRGPGIYNYHIYTSQKVYRPVLVVDEAHNLLKHAQDSGTIILWDHVHDFGEASTYEEMESYLRRRFKTKPKQKGLAKWWEVVCEYSIEYMAMRTEEAYYSAATPDGETRPCVKLIPMNLADHARQFWPQGEVEKIILLSATIGPSDIGALGLGSGRRVLYLECASPIPAEGRPVLLYDKPVVARATMTSATQEIGRYIQDYLLDVHEGEKGIIHATYAQVEILRRTLKHPRFMFHTKYNKQEVYQAFRDSSPEEGRVLVASGMYEGIDLPDDLGRWQCITKIPWPSLANPTVAAKRDREPSWYTWETWKVVMQACGRVCRTPTDFGITYVLDGSIRRLCTEAESQLPKWFVDALDEGEKYG